MKLSFRKLMDQKRYPSHKQWHRPDPAGSVPVTPKQVRKIKRGTARMATNRGSEKLNRLLRSAFVSVLELMVVVVACTLFGRFLYTQFQGASVGRAVIQAILAAAGGIVFLTLTHNRYRDNLHKEIAIERDVQLRADQSRADGADPSVQPGRAAGVDRQRQARPAEDVTTVFNQHDPFDPDNQPWQ